MSDSIDTVLPSYASPSAASPSDSRESATQSVADSAREIDSATDADHARRFGGVARLYGTAGLQRFEQARVAVIGIGGVGSWAAEALARTAIGHLTLIDLDHVGESNTNRQLHALEGNYGKAKVDAMAERIRAINPYCDVQTIDDFIAIDNFDALLGGGRFDYLIDAIDNTRTKTALIAWCKAQGQAMITVGSAGGQIDPLRIRISDLSKTVQDPLLAKVRQQLRREHGFSKSLKTRFGISAVYSDEPLRYPGSVVVTGASAGVGVDTLLTDAPACDIDTAAAAAPADHSAGADIGPTGLNCAGFGSSVCVTASFGLAAASHVLMALASHVPAPRTTPGVPAALAPAAPSAPSAG